MNKDIEIKIYDYLPEDARKIRSDVFVSEHGFVEEFDAIDDRAEHIVLYLGGEAAATCRVFEENGDHVLGRVATYAAKRGSGLGSRLLFEAEKLVLAKGGGEIKISARLAAREFYEKNGYESVGDVYYDEGQKHIAMIKELK